jgi:hypothetical protein
MTALRSFQSFKMFQSFQTLRINTRDKERIFYLAPFASLREPFQLFAACAMNIVFSTFGTIRTSNSFAHTLSH